MTVLYDFPTPKPMFLRYLFNMFLKTTQRFLIFMFSKQVQTFSCKAVKILKHNVRAASDAATTHKKPFFFLLLCGLGRCSAKPHKEITFISFLSFFSFFSFSLFLLMETFYGTALNSNVSCRGMTNALYIESERGDNLINNSLYKLQSSPGYFSLSGTCVRCSSGWFHF